MLRKTLAKFFIFALLATPAASYASAVTTTDPGFDPNFILTDDDIFDVNGMTHDALVTFLRSKGTLANYKTLDIDGTPKTAADIIWRVSRSYVINPKYLLALIQKEQSLVEDPNPSQNQFDWAAGYAICDSCAKDDPDLQQFKGFASQLEWAAKQHREKYLFQLLMVGTTIGGQGKGKTVTIDNTAVTPVNRATAMLYSYTPHISGNLTLWRIWKRWFSVSYPDGTIVKAQPSGTVYLLRSGERRPFGSPAVVASRVDVTKIVSVKEGDIASIPVGPMIKFPPYALLRDPNGHIFLLTEGGKRRIANMTAFHKFSFNEDEIEDVTSDDLAAYPEGATITVDTQFPQGVLMRQTGTAGVWYIDENGTRHALLDRSLLTLYFNNWRVHDISATGLSKYAVGDPYKIHDGELVKAKGTTSVYVIENGMLRAIPSGDVFESVGWKWKNVITVPQRLLDAHPLGAPFTPTASPDIQTASAIL